jgi:nitroreductase
VGDVRLRLLARAILAPSALNKQPWWVDLRGEGILVHADRRRLSPAADPGGRLTMQSTGTFLEFLALAASAEGYAHDVSLFPRGLVPTLDDLDRYPVAAVTLRRDGGVPKDPLFDAIPVRHTNRFEFSGPPLVEKEERALRTAAGTTSATVRLFTGPADVATVAAVVAEAVRRETESFTMYAEAMGMLRFSAEEMERLRDGFDLTSYGIRGAGLLLTRLFQDRNDVFTDAFRERHLELARRAAFSARAYGLISTPGETRGDDVDAGRAFARVHLAATALGLALQPVGAVLRFEETRDRLTRLAGAGDGEPQLLFRLGRAPDAPRTPRRPVKQIIGLHEP